MLTIQSAYLSVWNLLLNGNVHVETSTKITNYASKMEIQKLYLSYTLWENIKEVTKWIDGNDVSFSTNNNGICINLQIP